jgi:hypothetical protein
MKSLRLSEDVYSILVRIKGYIEFKTGKTTSLPKVVSILSTLIHPDYNKKETNTKSELFTVLGPNDCVTLGEVLRKNKGDESYSDKIKSDNI